MKKRQIGLLIVVGFLLSGCLASVPSPTCYHQDHGYINAEHYKTHYEHYHGSQWTGHHCYNHHVDHS